MNKTESKFNFKTLLAFLTVLVLTLAMVFATACNNNGSTSESTSESESESTSEAKKDTQTLLNGDFEFTSSKSFPATPSSWSYTTDGSPYTAPTTSSRGMIDTETTAYDKLSSSHKNEGKNPGTPISTDNEDTAADEAGTKVLMLHNSSYTAHYYTSSTTLKVDANQYGKFSVWVRTDDIETEMGAKSGAYIKVKNNVVKADSNTYNPLSVENINTNGKWVNYVIYVAPNATKATSFTLVLGLGQGNKFLTEKLCKGYAYFDNASFEYVSKEEYTSATSTFIKSATTANEDFIVDTSEVDYATVTTPTVKLSLVEGTTTDITIGGSGEYNKVNINNPNGDYAVTEGDAGYTTTEKTVGGNTFTNGIYMDFTSLKVGSSYTYTTDTYTLANETYVRISFLAKIDAPDYATKATIAVYDVVKGDVVASFDNVSTTDYENEFTDGFARYTFYIANNFPSSYDEMNYSLKFTFGPSERSSVTDIKTLPVGYAIFKDFEIETLADKDAYTIADTSTDTRAKKAVLIGDNYSDYVEEDEDEDEDEDSSNDSYSITVNTNAALRMEEGEIVNLNDLSSTNLYSPATAEDATIGVVNSKYADKYDANVKSALEAVKAKIQNDNVEVQALLLNNLKNKEVYISANQVTIPANTTYVFSIKVYAYDSAKAFVNLVNMGDATTADKKVMVYDVTGSYNMETEIVNADCVKFLDGYAQVTFIVTSGADTLNLRLEFGAKNQGVVLFDSISSGSSNSTYTSFDAVKTAFEDDYTFTTVSYTQEKIYYYANETDAKNDENRIKENGADKYDEGEAYNVVAFGSVGTDAKLIQYYRYDTANKYVIEEGADKEESTPESIVEDENANTAGQNLGWLQVTSVVIALVLVAALIAVVIRKSFANKTKKKNKTKAYYHQGYNKDNRYSKGNVAVPDADDNSKEYDYDNPENN